jgi:TatD DNase family protein
MIIDTHAHLTLIQFDHDREQILDRSKKNNVQIIIEVGFNLERSKKAVSFAEKNEFIYSSIGLHPLDVDNISPNFITELTELFNIHKKIVGFGEIGLDYSRLSSPLQKEKQKNIFIQQIECAHVLNLPLIIHCRDAHDDMKKILSDFNRQFQGIIHSFSGDLPDAQFYISKGFVLGIGGPITYPNAEKLRNVVKDIPLEKIVLETDSPYLPPQAFRGKRNEPSYLTYVVEKISEVKNLSKETVEDITTQTAKKLFLFN